MIVGGPNPWDDLGLWMQRRSMVAHCLARFDMGDSREDVTQLIELIDLGIRARLRFLLDLSVQQSIATIPMPRSRRRKKETV